MTYSPHQLACFAHQLTRRAASNSMDRMAGALLDAQVDLNPHQIDAALFATSNPLSRGAILADEVGLGKTIEAGLLIAQKWAERKRRILVITPANLRKLLASSTFAIAGALETLSKRLGQALDELADELDAVADGSTKASTASEIAAIKAEVGELQSLRDLAVPITENAKGTALLQALKVAFKKLDASRPHSVTTTCKEATMNRSRAIELLRACKPILADRYGVVDLALFGSTARDTARSDSDIDILVAFAGPATSERYFGVQFYLEDLFGVSVDLVTDKALRRELRPFVEKEAVHV